jgi:hypothetical protein
MINYKRKFEYSMAEREIIGKALLKEAGLLANYLNSESSKKHDQDENRNELYILVKAASDLLDR